MAELSFGHITLPYKDVHRHSGKDAAAVLPYTYFSLNSSVSIPFFTLDLRIQHPRTRAGGSSRTKI